MTPDGRPESYREAIWMGARDVFVWYFRKEIRPVLNEWPFK